MASYPEGFRAPEILAAGKLETAPQEKGCNVNQNLEVARSISLGESFLLSSSG
jgi:hypothetical protein